MSKKKRIFINASTVLISGGLIVTQNIINALIINNSFEILITCPSYKPYKQYATSTSRVIVVPQIMLNKIFRWYHDYIWLPLKIRRFDPSLVFTLSNIPACTSYKQLYLHDNPYVTENFWPIKMPILAKINHQVRKLVTYNRLKYVDHIIVQTSFQKHEFSRINKFEVPISVVSPGIPIHLNANKSIQDINLSKKYRRIACISRYFSHKNLEILYKAANYCAVNYLPIQFILTISPTEDYYAKQLIKKIDIKYRQTGTIYSKMIN